MASLDTNVPLRYLVRDDEPQFEQARELIKQQIQARQPLNIPITMALDTLIGSLHLEDVQATAAWPEDIVIARHQSIAFARHQSIAFAGSQWS
jgi:predicted nucleic acid-binding protein